MPRHNIQPFTCRNEQDVRERIIYPLLTRLGYSPDMVTTELTLKYEWLFLGHKKGTKKDRPLTGKPDYIMDVDGRLRWVVDAKKPGEISDDDREQAFSYAMHPQVPAIVFAVISGTHFEVYHTFEKPEAGPLISFRFEELETNFQKLANLVSPSGLRLSHPGFELDAGMPLAPGLRSFAKIEAGKMTYTECPPFGENVVGLSVHLTDGSLVRRKEGGISMFVTPSWHHQRMTDFQNAIAPQLELECEADAISTDSLHPTVFKHRREIVVTQGTSIPSFNSLTVNQVAPATVRSEVEVVLCGHLEGKIFRGKLEAYSFAPAIQTPFRICADFELRLS